jgi:O-antigen biosynthesis protein
MLQSGEQVPLICFVTSIIGAYEATCKKPVEQTIPCHFIVYTDNPSIETHGVWKTVDACKYYRGLDENDVAAHHVNSLTSNTHSFNRAKFFKLNLHRLPELSNYQAVVWLDGTVQVTNPRCAEICIEFLNEGKNLATFVHEFRKGTLKEEVAASHFERYTSTYWNRQHQPYQDVDKQYNEYLKQGFSDVGIWVTCFVLFDMRKDISKLFLQEWWMQTLMHTTQDQISFPFVCWKLGVMPTTLPDGRIKGLGHSKTDFYIKHPHGR